MFPLRRPAKSAARSADALVAMEQQVSLGAVGRLLHTLSSGLQAIPRQILGTEHRDREAQFRYVSSQVQDHLGQGQPVVSVSTREKELAATVADERGEWSGDRLERLDVQDFGDPGMAATFLHDLSRPAGALGENNDPASFALTAIALWWETLGSTAYRDSTRLLITAEGKGSGGYRNPLWIRKLAALSERTGLEVTVCHYPPAPSEGNRLERLLFSGLSLNWRGPRISHEVAVELVGAPRPRSRLKVRAEIVQGGAPKGTKMSRKELAALPLTGHQFHGEWNYTARPRSP